MDEITILPEQAAVMPLPGALLFPHALLPLYIFEPRYREMLDHALARERMFCVTLIKPDRLQWKSPDDFFHVATIGLIRACVGRGDGTSNLILQGLQRVHFTDFVQLHDRQLPAKLDRYLSDLNDLAMLADLMAATFVLDPLRRQQILEQRDLNARLRLVIQYLREETGHAAA
ncbi:MAG: hypothetical protein DMF03_09985 [Verrucomicrobia bacterium]|nr:MAG: hypothetical protein DMF03_09985 [Verrucomicrobiota bacterium]